MRNKQIFAVGKTYKSVIQDILQGNTTTLWEQEGIGARG
jgi:hypothetical protein